VNTDPRYNIRAVARLTGVPAPTLRSWERRYGFPVPSRTRTARRLYSETDVEQIRWVRAQTEHGLSAGQAIDWARSGGAASAAVSGAPAAASEESLVRAQIEAVHTYDEEGVEAALTAAFARYPADRVLLQVIAPALEQVGELWAAGEIPVAAEHFYSNIIRRRLLALLAAQPAVSPRLTAVLACLPGEQHELGLLMLALFLRWAGARVIYLGADLPLADLVLLAAGRSIDVICLSAGREASWEAIDELLRRLPGNGRRPHVFVGGAAVAGRTAPVGVTPLDLPLPEAAAAIVESATRAAP
jgi:methanogenic corrinoid protein MtbC1